MAKRGGNIVLNSYDDLFETQQSKEDAGKEKVDTLVIDDLHSCCRKRQGQGEKQITMLLFFSADF